jgi:hypothetical protein
MQRLASLPARMSDPIAAGTKLEGGQEPPAAVRKRVVPRRVIRTTNGTVPQALRRLGLWR